MPSPSADFVTMIAEMLAPLGCIRFRRMFGGVCFYADDLAFALIADDVLYVKVDDVNEPAHVAAGLELFRPFPDKPTALRYRRVPDSAFEDPDEMLAWAGPALAVARRSAAGTIGRRSRR